MTTPSSWVLSSPATGPLRPGHRGISWATGSKLARRDDTSRNVRLVAPIGKTIRCVSPGGTLSSDDRPPRCRRHRAGQRPTSAEPSSPERGDQTSDPGRRPRPRRDNGLRRPVGRGHRQAGRGRQADDLPLVAVEGRGAPRRVPGESGRGAFRHLGARSLRHRRPRGGRTAHRPGHRPRLRATTLGRRPTAPSPRPSRIIRISRSSGRIASSGRHSTMCATGSPQLKIGGTCVLTSTST